MGILSNNKTDPYFINPRWFGNYFILTDVEGDYDIDLFFDRDKLINLGNRWLDDFDINQVNYKGVSIDRDCVSALNNIICHTESPVLHSNRSGLFLPEVRKYTEPAIKGLIHYSLDKWDWIELEESLKWDNECTSDNYSAKYLAKTWVPLFDIDSFCSSIYLYSKIKINIVLTASDLKSNKCISLIYSKKQQD